MATVLAEDVRLRALLPRRVVEASGPAEVGALFARWFGATEAFELVDATVGEVGGRLHLRWRVRLRAERLGVGWFVVEQQAYADADADRITACHLLCSGYRPEAADG